MIPASGTLINFVVGWDLVRGRVFIVILIFGLKFSLFKLFSPVIKSI